MPRAILTTAVVMLFGGLLASCGANETADRSITVPADGVTSVRIVAGSGNLEVVGQAGLTEVSATGTAYASTVSRLDDIQFVVTTSGSQVVIEAGTPANNTEFDVVIAIPDTLDVEIDDGSGNIIVRDVASVRLTDGSGDVDIDRVNGNVIVEDDGSGNLDIRNVTGGVEIEQDDSGNIDIADVAGDVLIGADGSGNIDIADVEGSVHIGEDGSGDITVRNISGDFTVGRDGSGNINHSNVGGTVDLERGLAPVSASAASLTTELGDYELAGRLYPADLGTLTVLENRNAAESRSIELPFIRIHATGADPAEPIFLLAGGPGGTNLVWDGEILAGLLENHDLVLVGYRGVDGSVSLDAPEVTDVIRTFAENPLSGENLERLGEAYATAFQRLQSEGIDMDSYTMIDVIDDLEDARVQLGYDRINLLGLSYGTRVAYLYGLRHPDSLQRSALLAVNSPGHFVFEPDRIDAQLRYYADLWQRDGDAVARSRDIIATMRAVLATLPQDWEGFRIDPDKVRFMTHFSLFHRDDAARVFDAYVAAEAGDYAGLAYLSVAYDQVWPTAANWGERASKALSADYNPDRNYSADMNPADSILGSPLSVELGALGDSWPVQPLPEEYRSLRESQAVTLLINGSVDFSTPVENAQELLPFLPNGELVVISEAGHVNDLVLRQPEAILHLLGTFYSTGEVDASRFEHDPMDFTPDKSFQEMAGEFVAQMNAPAPEAGNVYQDPEGRFSMALVGDWTPVETDGTFAQFAYADLPLFMSLAVVETDDLVAGMDAALRQVGVDPAALTETSRSPWDRWDIIYYSLGGGRGVTVLGQTSDDISYLIVATGDEVLTANPPEDILATIQGFSLSGEVSLPVTVEEFEAYVRSFVGTRPPGLSVAIAMGGDIVYSQGFGIADGPRGIAVAPNAVFHWGSVTKTVTATAIMQLVEQGLIDLDAPVSSYLDYFPAQHPITVRHLLTHSSGLPEPPEFVFVNLRLKGQPLPDFDAVDREFHQGVTNLMFEPGTQSAYVNTDYLTLGQIVAAVSGQPYVEYVLEHILVPLGMTNTNFTYANDFMEANAVVPAAPAAEAAALIPLLDVARGLGDGADFFRETDENLAWMNHFIVGESAGGGLMGPATEMIRFAQMMLNGGELDGTRILAAESVALFQEVQSSTTGEPLGIGLAWFLVGDPEHRYIEHDGGGTGIQAKLRLYVDDGFAVAIMANGAGFDRNELADAAANVIFGMLSGPAPAPATEAFTPPITDASGNVIPGSIAALEQVTLGGVDQWIMIRGADTSKPVLLVLHGGPGFAMTPWVELYQSPALEENFVVVNWDQRGAGKSYSPDLTADDMTVANLVSDTLELTELLRERFGQDKIFLTGHSWGSALGFLAIMENSEPYHAYIASAEAAHWNRRQQMSYRWVLEQARNAGDAEIVETLENLEPFDPTSEAHIDTKNQFLDRYRGGDYYTEGLWDEYLAYALEGRSPAYTPTEIETYLVGLELSAQTLGPEIALSDYNLFRDFPESPIPIHILAGRHDHQTPGELAEEYYMVLEAPAKSFTWFEQSGHTLMFDEPDRWAEELIRIAEETLAR